MQISISILGLYAYDETIFENVEVPDGVDKEVLIAEIISECSDFTLLYPDGDFMKMMLGVWSKKEKRVWEAMQNSTELEYNPIENFDRYESITRSVVGKGHVVDDGYSKRTGEETANTKTSYTSFNSLTAKENNRVESTGDSTDETENTNISDSENSGTETVESHLHGNIGVTTAQQMIAGYREISNFTVYQFIVDSFKKRFCLQVY